MAHSRTQEADRILGCKFRVLKNGYVRLVDYMGSDERIAKMAKEYYPHLVGSDEEAIISAVRRGNRDILGMVELKYHFEMPIADALKFVYEKRASVNEFSLRYSEAEDVFETLDAEALKDEAEYPKFVEKTDREFAERSFEMYRRARDEEVAKELSRVFLGANLNTRFYWKINLRDLFEMVEEDVDNRTSEEKEYFDVVLGLAAEVAPETVSSFLAQKGINEIDLPPPFETNRIQHEESPDAEDILDRKIPILDGQGSVTLVDYMGNDMSVLNAARVSTGRNEKPRTDAENKGLINYLRRHSHTTPSEMVEFLWVAEIPLFVYRQLGRHRTFEKLVIDSDTDPKLKCYVPNRRNINVQSTGNHQGRGEEAEEEVKDSFLEDLEVHHKGAFSVYKIKTDFGVDPVRAKRSLPVSRMIKVILKTDLHNAMHYLGLRLDPHAQLEIREPAAAMAEGIKAAVPWSYQAFEDYQLNDIRFSAKEIPVLEAILNGSGESTDKIRDAMPESWTRRSSKTNRLRTNRERDEFLEKIRKLGLEILI